LGGHLHFWANSRKFSFLPVSHFSLFFWASDSFFAIVDLLTPFPFFRTFSFCFSKFFFPVVPIGRYLVSNPPQRLFGRDLLCLAFPDLLVVTTDFFLSCYSAPPSVFLQGLVAVRPAILFLPSRGSTPSFKTHSGSCPWRFQRHLPFHSSPFLFWPENLFASPPLTFFLLSCATIQKSRCRGFHCGLVIHTTLLGQGISFSPIRPVLLRFFFFLLLFFVEGQLPQQIWLKVQKNRPSRTTVFPSGARLFIILTGHPR